MTTEHLHWDADALWRQLDPHLPGLSVEVVAQAESTNTTLLERARSGAGRRDAPVTTPGELEALRAAGAATLPAAGGARGRRAGDTQPALLVAAHQTRGRGRLGRAWLAAPGASLTFSLALVLAPRDWLGLSLAAGVAVADAIDPPLAPRAPRILLKWPNDLWLVDGDGRGRKLGGVLVETMAVGGQRLAVIGVGLNVAPLAAAPSPREMTHGYGCVQEIDPQASAPAVLHRVALPLVRAVRRFEREGFAGFAAAYARRDLLRGREVDLIDAARGEPRRGGRCEGVADNGALLVRRDDGTLDVLASGEVSVRMSAA